MSKRRFPYVKALVYAIALAALVGGRGTMLANLMEGRYPFRAFVSDLLGLSLLIALLYLGNAVIVSVGKWLFRSSDNAWAPRAQQALRAAYLLFIGFPFLLASLQIHPQRVACTQTPTDFGLRYEAVELLSDNLRLSAWWVPHDNPDADIVLVAHGLNANKQNFIEPVLLLHEAGFHVLTFDFRAHGDSEGRQITLGYKEADDVKAAHDWLTKNHPGHRIHALGYSMGASAILRAAARDPLFERIAVDGTFSSLQSVAEASVLRFAGPFKTLLWDLGRFWIHVWTGADLSLHRPAEYIQALDPERLMIIHGTADPIIPHRESELLLEASHSRAKLWLIDGAGHAETVTDARYQDRLTEFFDTKDK